MRLAGTSYREIGQALGVTRQYIHTLIGAMPLPNPTRERARELRATGATYAQIAAEMGITPSVAHNYASDVALTDEQRAEISARAGFTNAAVRLGISAEEYASHRDAGERRCSVHHAWEPAERFVWQAGSLGYICQDGNRENVRRYQTPEYHRDYYRRTREQRDAYRRAWRNEHPEKVQAYGRTAYQRRRARQQEATS